MNLHPRLFLDRNHRRIAVGLRIEQILRMRPDAVLEMIERLDSQPLRCLADQIRDRSRVGPLGLILLVVGLRLANRRKLFAVLLALGCLPLGLLDLVVERYRSRITPFFRNSLAIEVRNQIVHRGDLGFQKQIAIDSNRFLTNRQRMLLKKSHRASFVKNERLDSRPGISNGWRA